MADKLIDPEAVGQALAQLTEQRDAAIEQAVQDGHNLFCVARILDDVPVELEIENQIEEIVRKVGVSDDRERAEVAASIRNRFAQLERKLANV